MLDTLLLALVLVLVIEGLMPLIAPRQWRGLFRQITELADGQLRFIGLISVVAGFLVILLLN